MSGLKWGLISPISGLTWNFILFFLLFLFCYIGFPSKKHKTQKQEDEVHVRPEIGLITPHFRPDMDFILFFLLFLFCYLVSLRKNTKRKNRRMKSMSGLKIGGVISPISGLNMTSSAFF